MVVEHWAHIQKIKGLNPSTGAQHYKLFTAVITPLAAYCSMILTELRR
jgi:hypothetical protein